MSSAPGSPPLVTTGRIFFAIAMLAFGIQYAVNGRLADGLPPVPYWIVTSSTGNHIAAYLTAAILVVTSLAILFDRMLRTASLLLGVFTIFICCFHLTHLHDVIHDAGVRTGFLEPLALGAGALILHALTHPIRRPRSLAIGRVLYGVAMIIFGIQHFEVFKFIVGLVPAWIPFHKFWAVFTGIVFIVAGLAILFRRGMKAAGLALAAMFFGWLATLHIPLCIAAPRDADLRSSLFVVVGLCGTSLFVAAAAKLRT
jgi:uncharacterized membrane protein